MSDISLLEKSITDRGQKVRDLEAKLTQEKAYLDEERRALAVLQRVRGIIPPAVKGHQTEGESANGYGFVKAAVRNAIAHASAKEFTVRDVMDIIRRASPNINPDTNRSNITTYMRELAEVDGEVEVITEGSGRRPAYYRKK